MLDELHVLNIGVIEDLTIQLGPGMTVISGETGAGKTLIVDALALLSGQRSDTNLVRSGSVQARIEARLHNGDEEFILARQIGVDSPSRAYINNTLCRAGDLADFSDGQFHIYGQHDAQLLFSPSAQAATLDEFSEVNFSEYDNLKLRLKESRNRLDLLGGDERARQRELSICQSEFDEISAVHLTDPNEDSQIKSELELLTNAIEFRESLQKALSVLIECDGQPSAMDQLGEARHLLAHTRSYGPTVERLSDTIDDLREIGRDIQNELERLDPDPSRFDRLQERLQLLSKIKRRYGDTLYEVINYRDKIAERIEELTSFELVASRIEEEIRDYMDRIIALEAEIFSLRQNGSKKLSQGVTDRLGSLAMPHGRFEVQLGTSGIGDPVSFMFSSNPGEKLGPLAKVASGGELSRLMLAIRLLSASKVPTMIFDEVDAGIGGRTAVTVGQALSELSKTKQVIVVTHLAQVAAYADCQIAATKSFRNDRTVTEVSIVSGEQRISELARMLSGHNDSQTARDHARELLSKVQHRARN